MQTLDQKQKLLIDLALIVSIFLTHQTASAEVVYARIAKVLARDDTTYYASQTIPIAVSAAVLGKRGDPVIVLLEVKSQNGIWKKIDFCKITVRHSDELTGCFLSWTIPTEAKVGNYDARISIWKTANVDDENPLLTEMLDSKVFENYFQVEEIPYQPISNLKPKILYNKKIGLAEIIQLSDVAENSRLVTRDDREFLYHYIVWITLVVSLLSVLAAFVQRRRVKLWNQ